MRFLPIRPRGPARRARHPRVPAGLTPIASAVVALRHSALVATGLRSSFITHPMSLPVFWSARWWAEPLRPRARMPPDPAPRRSIERRTGAVSPVRRIAWWRSPAWVTCQPRLRGDRADEPAKSHVRAVNRPLVGLLFRSSELDPVPSKICKLARSASALRHLVHWRD